MKKMMMMVAVTMVAGLVQAASVVWNSGAMTGPSAESLANSTAYLMTVYFFSDAAGTTPINAGTGVQISDDTASATGAYAGTSASVFTGGVSAGYYAQMVIQSDDLLYTRTSEIRQLARIPPIGTLGINFSTGNNFVGGTAGGTLFTSGWVAVPEPTSFALLALGAAALGLRRRIRKA